MDYGNITLFETSWEVCNKVGGIYTVVSSKALQASDNFGENYWLIGPDLGNHREFEEGSDPVIEPVAKILAEHNLKCRIGYWNIPGHPKVILVDFKNRYDQGQLLHEYWNEYGVDSLSGGWDYIEPVMFATACGEVIAAIYQHILEPAGQGAVAHFHEWMCGAGILYLKKRCPTVGTVFTTHATMLGRAMSGSGQDLYARIARDFDPRREAANQGVTAKHSMEAASAKAADCFTTVSAITAEEAQAILSRKADIITTNGLDLRVIPNYATERAYPRECRARVLGCAQKMLGRALPKDTRIAIISGRYEFRNKGIDLFLEAMGRANRDFAKSDIHVLAILTVMGGHSGVSQGAVEGRPQADGSPRICTHHVYDVANDPILNTCRRLGLDNKPGNNVQVIFNPAQLDGEDGFFNMTYSDLLAAADLGVFPSWYEPWGYTPEESIAYGVPTITSDLAGFGLWVRATQNRDAADTGVSIVARRNVGQADAARQLAEYVSQILSYPAEKRNKLRHDARKTACHCDWSEFYPLYLKAYNHALAKSLKHGAKLTQKPAEEGARIMTGATSGTPLLHPFTSHTNLPKPIARLRELAHNLWWSWHPECWPLFERIDPQAWEESGHAPVQCIEAGTNQLFNDLVADSAYLSLYEETMKSFDEYMARPVNESGEVTAEHPVAYFSTEYGINESLPVYSGGLGVLSGDHLKSSSDLNIPLVGIGLFYRFGYFRQEIDNSGRQIAIYPENDPSTLPMELVKMRSGEPLEISIPLPGRKLYARVWLVRVGTIRLYLMDTNVPRNTPDDRQITGRLYVADRDFRIRQEILLGMGGVALLEALQITPSVYHMNEGHSAFMLLERIYRAMIKRKMSFEEAGEFVRIGCVFTTHTPVAAGNERFSEDLMRRYFSEYATRLGLPMERFLNLGRAEGNTGAFEMTILALRYSCRANGVSRLHGDVSRHMWNGLWKGVPTAEVPIGHVTNGIHSPTWTGLGINILMNNTVGRDWAELPSNSRGWYKVDSIPDKSLWRVRQFQKLALLDYLKDRLPAFYTKFGVSRQDSKTAISQLGQDTLLIGFARRFAPYKRANLLFADLDRLERILTDTKRPVALLFAGKAHPADSIGIDIMQMIIRHCTEKRFLGHIFFLEDYSLHVSRLMVQGCDVWLNTPRRPYEASGTSGQKAAANGVLNLSIADGWWCEGYDGNNGWTIGKHLVRVSPTDNQNDYEDAESLYALLEEQVVPLYYMRDEDSIPASWMRMVKDCLRTLIPGYSSNRMVRDYMDFLYTPCAARRFYVVKNDYAAVKQVTAWRKDVSQRFGSLRTGVLRIDGMDGDSVGTGQKVHVTLSLNPGSMKREEIAVQLVVGPYDGSSFYNAPEIVNLAYERTTSDNSLVYSCEYETKHNGPHAYGVRVMPVCDELVNIHDSHMVIWA